MQYIQYRQPLSDRKACEGARSDDLVKIKREFAPSSLYELMFWDMSWREEGWIVE
ncbi:MAG: hypothetical protein ACOX87_12205 [Chloroflexota bacterium]|jgi:thiaminase